MRLQAVYGFLLICAAVLPLQLHAQNARDPLSGTWTGDWGPTPSDRNHVTVELKWDGKSVTGFVSGSGNVAGPGTAVVSYKIDFKKASYDPKTGSLHLEADAYARGYKVHYIIDGPLQNDTLSGTWKHGDRKGNFKLSRQG